MIYRMVTIPLNEKHYNQELEYIKKVVVSNGYKSNEMDRMVNNTRRKVGKANLTKLTHVDDDNFKNVIAVHYYKNVNNKLKSMFKMVETKLVRLTTTIYT